MTGSSRSGAAVDPNQVGRSLRRPPIPSAPALHGSKDRSRAGRDRWPGRLASHTNGMHVSRRAHQPDVPGTFRQRPPVLLTLQPRNQPGHVTRPPAAAAPHDRTARQSVSAARPAPPPTPHHSSTIIHRNPPSVVCSITVVVER